MDPLLQLALQNVETTARGALRAAKAGDFGTAALEFSQASMILGMQIGHQRARLGPRYAVSPEAQAIDSVAARLSTAIALAYAAPASRTVARLPELMAQTGPSDDDIEVHAAYGRWDSPEENE
jgi:hypothetical protein